MVAAANGSKEVVEALLNKGADIGAASKVRFWPPPAARASAECNAQACSTLVALAWASAGSGGVHNPARARLCGRPAQLRSCLQPENSARRWWRPCWTGALTSTQQTRHASCHLLRPRPAQSVIRKAAQLWVHLNGLPRLQAASITPPAPVLIAGRLHCAHVSSRRRQQGGGGGPAGPGCRHRGDKQGAPSATSRSPRQRRAQSERLLNFGCIGMGFRGFKRRQLPRPRTS